MKEKEYAPFYRDLKPQWYPTGNLTTPNEVVGMSISRDGEGYATRCFCSDGIMYEFPRDLEKFFKVADDRIFFVDGVSKDLEPIVKYLGEDICTRLVDGFAETVDGVGVTYHPNGSLATRKAGGRSLRHIYSLKPFFPAYMLPEEDDCYGVQARGERLIKTMVQSNMPLKLSSCGAILSAISDLPFHSSPNDVTEIAYNCYHGGWIEAMKLGRFERAYDYDLSAAYPTEAAKLYSCSSKCGAWFESTHYIQEALYGFCYCHIKMDINLPLSPIMVRLRSYMSPSGRYPMRVVRNPIGEWEGWLTMDEIRFISKNWLGIVKILYGKWFVPTRFHQPFLELVGFLQNTRRNYEKRGDKLGKNISKITAASLQGKLMQSFLKNGARVTGNAFNPVYAATITSRVRLKVAEIALENYDDILMIMVDGILSTKPLAVPKQWKLEYEGDCVIANHGDYDIAGRVTASNLREALQKDPWATKYALRSPRYVSLTEAIEGKSFHYAGCHRPEVKAGVRRVGKRNWDRLPITCEDVLTKQYESSPLFVTESIERFHMSDDEYTEVPKLL